jgi:hypothetical protein
LATLDKKIKIYKVHSANTCSTPHVFEVKECRTCHSHSVFVNAVSKSFDNWQNVQGKPRDFQFLKCISYADFGEFLYTVSSLFLPPDPREKRTEVMDAWFMYRTTVRLWGAQRLHQILLKNHRGPSFLATV